ncbi:MAG: hypothetical protein ACYDIE_10485 [Candidatus Krumholzibacteriia bacterium]
MKAPLWIVPALIVMCAAAGAGGARLFAAPSVTREFAAAAQGTAVRRVVFVVAGVRCVDTAEGAARQLAATPGALSFAAYASRGRVEVTYDPAVTGVPALIEAIEGPVYDEATHEFRFGVYAVREVNGVKVD